jgi:hypothetical protein
MYRNIIRKYFRLYKKYVYDVRITNISKNRFSRNNLINN